MQHADSQFYQGLYWKQCCNVNIFNIILISYSLILNWTVFTVFQVISDQLYCISHETYGILCYIVIEDIEIQLSCVVYLKTYSIRTDHDETECEFE